MPTKKASTKKPAAKKPVKKTTKTVAKKVTKKPAAKKPVKKAVSNKVNARKGREGALGQKASAKKPVKDLVYSPDEQSFWTTDGEILNSLTALADAFAAMEKDVYQFHAGGDQNDFATWVDVVLCDGDCAADLHKAKTPKSAKTVVVRHLKFYSV